MKLFKTLFIGILILIYSFLPTIGKEQINKVNLPEILRQTASYCEKVKKMAFDFVCEEIINEKIYHYEVVRGYRRKGADLMIPIVGFKLSKIEENSYIYDYQMIKKGDKADEKRILLKKNGKEVKKEVAQFSIRGLSAKYLVYGPVGFLSKYWQNHFNYQIIGQDEICGEETLIISAIPKSPLRDNNYNGTIWISVNDFSIIKIRWNPVDEKNKKLSSPLGDLERKINWLAVYKVEKNGVRFPSEQIIEEYFIPVIKEEYPLRITRKGEKQLKYEASYIYTNYKFFTVELDVYIK